MTPPNTAKIIRVVLIYICPKIVVCDHIELSNICEIRTETWISPILKCGFSQDSLGPGFRFFTFWTQVNLLFTIELILSLSTNFMSCLTMIIFHHAPFTLQNLQWSNNIFTFSVAGVVSMKSFLDQLFFYSSLWHQLNIMIM